MHDVPRGVAAPGVCVPAPPPLLNRSVTFCVSRVSKGLKELPESTGPRKRMETAPPATARLRMRNAIAGRTVVKERLGWEFCEGLKVGLEGRP